MILSGSSASSSPEIRSAKNVWSLFTRASSNTAPLQASKDMRNVESAVWSMGFVPTSTSAASTAFTRKLRSAACPNLHKIALVSASFSICAADDLKHKHIFASVGLNASCSLSTSSSVRGTSPRSTKPHAQAKISLNAAHRFCAKAADSAGRNLAVNSGTASAASSQ